MPSFTGQIPNLHQVGPVVEIAITPSLVYLDAIGKAGEPTPAIKVLAMIDTGATGTVIREGLMQKLKIAPISTTYINTPSHVNQRCLQYHVQMIFSNNVGVQSLVITEAPLQNQHIQCLIGRDILQQAVLIYIGYNNSFTLSF